MTSKRKALLQQEKKRIKSTKKFSPAKDQSNPKGKNSLGRVPDDADTTDKEIDRITELTGERGWEDGATLWFKDGTYKVISHEEYKKMKK